MCLAAEHRSAAVTTALAPARQPETTSGPPSLRAEGVTFSYGDRPAISDVTIHLPAGSVTALIGPNGSGKTTLLHVLAGLLDPASGAVEGPDRVAYMPHQHGIGVWMPLTVREVIGMGRYRLRGLIGRLNAADRRRVRDAAELLEVADLLRRQFGELSAGQRQRVLMAQTIMQEGDLLLLDEPITGLDLASQGRILEVIKAERAKGAIVVLSTHHLDEARRCDHVVLLANRLVAQGPPAEVLVAEVLQASYQGRIVQAGDCCGPEVDCCGPPDVGEDCCEHPADRLLVLDDHAHGHGDHDERAHA
ncbi:MAG: metal ABC transporter ATP-binding protein [Acidimicrobiia bacterium]|nr:metal ABC transporter ATP-binding protein [Acidimicrobiia bacterium]